MKKMIGLFALLLLVIFTAPAAQATEGGGGAYPNGAEDFMSGAVPPPGTYFIYYLNQYTADRFNNGSGASAVPGFELEATAHVFRFLKVTDTKIFGGNWGYHLFVPYVSLDVTTPGGSDSKSGIGDIIVDPIVLSWHSKNLHMAAGLDIYIPTADYEKGVIVNTVGRNYWTFEPVFAATYISDGGFEVSGKFMYDINLKNTDTDYRSGQEFHFDYTVGQKFGPLAAGVGGYYYRQMTDDKGASVAGDGNKGTAFAWGPQVKYDVKNMSFAAKYQKETNVENRPVGEKIWVKFIYAF